MTERNYRKEYDNYHSKPEQRVRNAARLRARRLMVKKGKAKKDDKLDVHHKDHDAMNNDPANLSVVTQKYNRTEPRLRHEDAPLNSTGPAVKGTGDDVFKGRKKKKKVQKRYKDMKDKTWESAEITLEGKLLDRLAKLAKVDGAEAEDIILTLKLDKKFKTGKDGYAWNNLVNTVEKLMKESIEKPVALPKDEPDATFASMPVFKVNDGEYEKCKFGKDKFARWSKHINTDSDQGKRIHTYAKKNPKQSIIVQHETSGHMLYLRKFSKKED